MTAGRCILLLAICSIGAVVTGVGCSCDGPSPSGGKIGGGSGGAGARDAGPDSSDLRPTGSGGKGGTTCTDTGPRSAARGQTCACNSDCTTGFCTDGVCCDSACKDRCTSCDLPGSEGTCSPVPEGVKARSASECPVEDPSTCGRDGTCDGNGACRLYVASVTCKGGTCDSDAVSGAYVCDGKGVCKPGPVAVCYPYGCADGKCRDKCATDGECAAGGKCMENSCGKVPNGRKCGKNDDCISDHCADGYCCNDTCDGACLSCNQTGFEGQCRSVGRGMMHSKCQVEKGTTCGMTGVCDGFGSCSVYAEDTTCSSPSCSSDDVASTPGTCDGNGVCEPPMQVKCAPYKCIGTTCATKCTTDMQCSGMNTCVSGSCGTKPMGAVCAAAAECSSNFCVDGICCESACQGACLTCGLSSSPGRCVNVAAGRDDPHKQCKDTGVASCGTDGKCDGSGACRRYGGDTLCSSEICNSGSYTPPAMCSASGQCLAPSSRSCFPYVCNGSRCFTSCTQNSQCVSPNTCVNGSCGLKPAGASCSGASECKAAPDGKQYCSQGVCCNSPCSGTCQACNVNGSVGICSSVPNGTADKTCPNKGVSTCGTNGTCRNGACDVYQTNNQCKAPSCSGTATSLSAAFCDGRGSACPGQGTVQCNAFTCDTSTGLCRTTCSDSSQCVSPNVCNTMTHSCGKAGNGASCTDPTLCQSGNCVEGVCCDTACSSAATGVCQSCKVANHLGTCTPVPSGGTDVGGRCKASDRMTCGLDGTCDGTGKCRNWGTSTTCRDQSCPMGSIQTNAATCDGKGACSMSTTKSCGDYVCNVSGATCLTTCTKAADCASGVTCNTQTNRCGDKGGLGTVCGVDTDCRDGHCAKAKASDATGICCDSSCTGGCQTCVGKGGICSSIAAGGAPRDSSCPVTAQSTCGNTGKCDGKGSCQVPADGTSCEDGDMCTRSGACKSGTCVGSNPITCTASDQCHVAGTCSPSTGLCSSSNAKDGIACSTGKCTTGDTCTAGVCGGGTPKVCAAPDDCHVAACDAATGNCVTQNAPNTTPCDVANKCTTGKTCTAGVCGGGTPKTCTASGECHVASCDPAMGCVTQNAPNTTPCDVGNKCTPGKTCTGGTCGGGTPKMCAATDECQVGVCDATSGSCTTQNAPPGTPCDVANKCVGGKTCMGGMCTGGTPKVVCTAMDDCHDVGVCSLATGTCSNPPKEDNAKCSDGKACTDNDKCKSGKCVGEVNCPASDDCHTAGECTATGCTNPPKCPGGMACCAGTCTDPDAGACQ